MQTVLQKLYEKIPLSLILFFCLLPFGNFFFRKMDVWYGMGMYVQIGILILFSLTLFKYNIPFGCFILWAGLFTGFIWYNIVSESGQYPIKIFFPFFNLLTIVILYKLLVSYLNIEYLKKLLKYLSYSLTILLFYCVLQFFNLDQFFKHFNEGVTHYNDQLVGTVGNSTLLAGFLAIITPLFINNIYAIILIGLLIFLCNSASGVAVAVSIILFYLFHTNIKRFFLALTISITGLTTVLICFNKFFNSEGRLELWKRVYKIFQEKPIVGHGLGMFGAMKIKLLPDVSIWRYAHEEYYQLAIELGLIGLALAIWCIYDYFRTFTAFKTDLTIKFASIFFGFCMLSLFSFPCHLWLLSTIGILSYSCPYIIKKSEVILENSSGN